MCMPPKEAGKAAWKKDTDPGNIQIMVSDEEKLEQYEEGSDSDADAFAFIMIIVIIGLTIVHYINT